MEFRGVDRDQIRKDFDCFFQRGFDRVVTGLVVLGRGVNCLYIVLFLVL